MTEQSCYFNQGRLKVAFVFSAPGRYEVSDGRPVSRATGANLNHALRFLHQHLPGIFESEDRYAYRITNAFSKPIWKAKDGKSEASAHEVLHDVEVERIICDLSGCNLVILCGVKAELLKDKITNPDRTILSMPHTGVRSLVNSYRHPKGAGCQVRAEDWATVLLAKWRAARCGATQNRGDVGAAP